MARIWRHTSSAQARWYRTRLITELQPGHQLPCLHVVELDQGQKLH
jgi:hypothetical protein